MRYWIALILTIALAPATRGADVPTHCECCGTICCPRKVCRATCEMKEVKSNKYTVKCEDYCIPGPSHREVCHTGCSDCPKVVHWKVSCGKVRTRKLLVREEEIKKVPVTKCTVEYLCPLCCAKLTKPEEKAAEKPAKDAQGQQPKAAVEPESPQRGPDELVPPFDQTPQVGEEIEEGPSEENSAGGSVKHRISNALRRAAR